MIVSKLQDAKSQDVALFHSSWKKPCRSFVPFPISNGELIKSPPFPSYCLRLPGFNFSLALKEANSLQSLFVEHRPNEGHDGWKGLTLHGLGSDKTMCPEDYGISPEQAKYDWTDVADQCPTIKNYLEKVYPAQSYGRIRLMLIEPKGFILPHRDREESRLGPLSIALNAPTDCDFLVENYGKLKLKPGFGYLIDISNRHCVVNRSDEPRYHLIVEALYGSKMQNFCIL
jgi:hypothetical protein